MRSPPFDDPLKVVLVGGTQTGKTAFLHRLNGECFTPDLPPTLGAEFFIRSILYDDKTVKFKIQDIAGQERFAQLVKMYYQDAAIIALFVDLTDTQNNSIDYIQKYVNGHIPKAAHCVVVFTKTDLLETIPPSEDLKVLATKTLNAAGIKREASPSQYCVTSSKTDSDDTFTSLLKSWTKRIILLSTTTNSFVLRTPLNGVNNLTSILSKSLARLFDNISPTGNPVESSGSTPEKISGGEKAP